jgi:hypothetical protein
MWNVTVTDVDQDIEKVSQAGHYNIFNFVDQDEITLTLVHHNMYFKVANVGVGGGGGFINMQELRVMSTTRQIMDLTGSAGKQKLKTSISKWSTAKCSSLF